MAPTGAKGKSGGTRPAQARSKGMRLTFFVAILFVAGLWPGLSQYQGGVSQPEPRKHVFTTLKEAPQPAPVSGWAQIRKLRS